MVEEEEQDTMDKKIGQHMALDKIKSAGEETAHGQTHQVKEIKIKEHRHG